MFYQFKAEQQLNCDITTAWNFFSSPHNLTRITPKNMNFRVITKLSDVPIYEGMLIDYSVSPVLGIPMKWQTLITQVDPQKSFTDFQKKGPYSLWHHYHEFIPNEKGVLMKDTVDYKLPFSFLGTFAHRIFVKKRLQHIFNYRYQILEQLFNQ
uniref:SRPBCC family protein n=1 Tax=Pedobacter schmidteae TaxID=2201271 RepID=UPI000EAB8101|nr:SRPBCC family protein [Pedobacter schmidteae]